MDSKLMSVGEKLEKLIEIENTASVLEAAIATHLRAFSSIYKEKSDKARWFAKQSTYPELESIDSVERDMVVQLIMAASFISACRGQIGAAGDDAKESCVTLLEGVYPEIDFSAFFSLQEWSWKEPLEKGAIALGMGKTIQIVVVIVIGLVMAWWIF